jgi:hypothetical protein
MFLYEVSNKSRTARLRPLPFTAEGGSLLLLVVCESCGTSTEPSCSWWDIGSSNYCVGGAPRRSFWLNGFPEKMGARIGSAECSFSGRSSCFTGGQSLLAGLVTDLSGGKLCGC